jgi:hypothetical protein
VVRAIQSTQKIGMIISMPHLTNACMSNRAMDRAIAKININFSMLTCNCNNQVATLQIYHLLVFVLRWLM